MKVYILLGKRSLYDTEKKIINIYKVKEEAEKNKYLGDILIEKELI